MVQLPGSQTAAILRADGIKYDNVIQDKLFKITKKIIQQKMKQTI